MKAVSFYLLLPLLYFIALLPFKVLYLIADFLYLILGKVVGYRKKVILTNLKNAFPEKTEKELLEITDKYYRYLADLFIESLKTICITEKEAKKVTKFKNTELFDRLYQENKNVVIVMGHMGNWELAGPCFSLSNQHKLHVVYKPLSNPYFENLFVKARTKFNTGIIPMKNTLRAMTQNRKKLNTTALVADQTPSDPKAGTWIKFLNQDTCVFTGPEKIAKMFNSPVVYIIINRVKRGYYEIEPTLLFEDPKTTEENEITLAFNKKLEEDIKAKPETWLWSHRRWKLQKPSNVII